MKNLIKLWLFIMSMPLKLLVTVLGFIIFSFVAFISPFFGLALAGSEEEIYDDLKKLWTR